MRDSVKSLNEILTLYLFAFIGTPQQICGQSRPAQAYVTQQGPLLLRFASGQTNVARKGFDLLITAYKDGKKPNHSLIIKILKII